MGKFGEQFVNYLITQTPVACAEQPDGIAKVAVFLYLMMRTGLRRSNRGKRRHVMDAAVFNRDDLCRR
jgi:hypothetical protein